MTTDGGWGWCIVIATFLCTFVIAGTAYSFSIIYVALLEAFGKSKATTAWIGSISLFCFTLSMPFGVALAGRFGHRKIVMTSGLVAVIGFLSSAFVTNLYQLYFTYGLLVGCGGGIVYITSVDIVGNYFKKKLSIALGLAMAGTGAGQFVMSLLCQMLVDHYGWRGMLIFVSGIAAHVCAAGALLRPIGSMQTVAKDSQHPYEEVELNENKVEKCAMNSHNDESISKSAEEKASLEEVEVIHHKESRKQSDDAMIHNEQNSLSSFFMRLCGQQLIQNPVFLIQVAIGLGQSAGTIIVLVHIVKRARELGIADTPSSFIVSAMGLAQLVGRPVFGSVGHSPKVKPYVLYSFAMATCGVSVAISIYTTSYAAQLVTMILFGACVGGYIIHIPIIMAFFHGSEQLGNGTAMILQTHGIMGLVVAPLSGWMRDTSGNYIGAFWLSSVLFSMSALLALTLPLVDAQVKRRQARKEIS
ncbi:monocarboxylate transporter 13-like [Ptychodera flava]|uniref:monocarboxylate transporter 13-like n=1 Tax=Ptychodera flava TaxID=63121 RepID=UPI00396A7A39